MSKVPHPFLAFSLLTGATWMMPISTIASAPLRSAALDILPVARLVQNRNVINGLVADSEGRPLNRMRVELCDEVEMNITQTYTDSTGRYSFRNLSQGTFIVKVHSDGVHVAQSARVSLFAARAGGGSHYEQLDFMLKTREETKGAATVPANTGTTFAQEVPANARKAYERAVKQLDNERQPELGIASLKEAINLFPTYFLALERLGVEYVKRQQYEPAREVLSKAVEVNQRGMASYYALGVAQFHLRQWPQASETLQRSLLLAPESANAAFAHFYLGLALIKIAKAAEGEPHLRKSLELGGNAVPPDVHMHLAQYYSNNKRYKEAADELELFLKRVPDARDAENIRRLIKQLRDKAK